MLNSELMGIRENYPSGTPLLLCFSSAYMLLHLPGLGVPSDGWCPVKFSPRNPIGGTECECVCQHGIHIRSGTNFLEHAVPSQVWLVHFLRILRIGDVHFIFFFLPETNGIPIEEMGQVWKNHWFWSRYVGEDDFVSNGGVELQKGNKAISNV